MAKRKVVIELGAFCESCDDYHNGDPCPIQKSRVKGAKDTLEYFARHAGGEWIEGERTMSHDMIEQNMSDLICNFAHYCDKKGVSLGEVLRRAKGQYEAESQKPKQEFEAVYS